MIRLTLAIVAVSLLVVVGCKGKEGQTTGYTKQDFARTPPPAGFLNSAPKPPAGPPASGGQAPR